jgi:hypothetical protein
MHSSDNLLLVSDFFNLASTRKPIQFVSKTLGLNVGSPEPTNASLDPLSKHTNPTLIDLSGDEDSSDPDDDIGNKFLDAKPKNRAHTRSLPTWTKASRIVHVDTFVHACFLLFFSSFRFFFF